MREIKENIWSILIIGIYILTILFSVKTENWFLFLIPIALIIIYFAVFEIKSILLFIFFITPFSINIEEYTNSFGLFLPTEPLLFGLLLLFILYQIRSSILPKFVFRNQITWALLLYITWIIISSITSSNPIVSFKFLLVKVWFIVPLIGFGTLLFREFKYVKLFIWLFCIGMILVIIYTISIHATFQFGEKQSHWVMWPFFKDHTIYGALVAFILPLLFGILLSKKHNVVVFIFLIILILINLTGLYFSYTRAAWLSIVAAILVQALIFFKIKFKYIALAAFSLTFIILLSWTQIQFLLEQNKEEHTTEDFGKRIESAANISSDASNLERINRWSCASAMFEERPVFGFGPGTYAFEYARFQKPENLTIISTNFGDGGNAHSEYLGPMAEMGLPGLIVTLILIATIFYKSITLYNKWPSEDRETKVLILAMILSLVTYFVHGILNNYLDTDKACVPIFSMLAIFIVLENQLENKKRVAPKRATLS